MDKKKVIDPNGLYNIDVTLLLKPITHGYIITFNSNVFISFFFVFLNFLMKKVILFSIVEDIIT